MTHRVLVVSLIWGLCEGCRSCCPGPRDRRGVPWHREVPHGSPVVVQGAAVVIVWPVGGWPQGWGRVHGHAEARPRLAKISWQTQNKTLRSLATTTLLLYYRISNTRVIGALFHELSQAVRWVWGIFVALVFILALPVRTRTWRITTLGVTASLFHHKIAAWLLFHRSQRVRKVTVLSTYRVWEKLHFLLWWLLSDGPLGQKADCNDCRAARGGLCLEFGTHFATFLAGS